MAVISFLMLLPTGARYSIFPGKQGKLLAILDIGALLDQFLQDLLALLRSHYHFQFSGVFPHTSDHSVVMRTAAGAMHS